MKRKKEIEEIKEKNENLRNSIEKLKRINVDNMKEVRNWYSKMNMHMIKRKNMHLWIKESMETEHLLELIIKRNEDIIINNNKLNELNNWKTFKKEEQNENKKRKKESIKKMKKQIEKLDKQIECAQFNIDSLQIKTKNANYIINPFSDIMEKYNEIYIQREMMFKFKDFYMKKKNENALLLLDINKVKKEYDSLIKNSKDIIDSDLEKIKIQIDTESSIGTIDSEIVNSVDSPRFLTKIKPKAKMNFQFIHKLDFDMIRKNTKPLSKKCTESIKIFDNPTIPIKTFSLSNIKKKDDKVKVIKNDLIQVKDLSDIDTELEESKKKIEDLKENLKQYMKINLLLTQQKKEVESDLQKEEKRIKKFQAELERMKNMNDIVESVVSNRDQFGKVVKQFNSSGPDDSGFFSISTENRK